MEGRSRHSLYDTRASAHTRNPRRRRYCLHRLQRRVLLRLDRCVARTRAPTLRPPPPPGVGLLRRTGRRRGEGGGSCSSPERASADCVCVCVFGCVCVCGCEGASTRSRLRLRVLLHRAWRAGRLLGRFRPSSAPHPSSPPHPSALSHSNTPDRISTVSNKKYINIFLKRTYLCTSRAYVDCALIVSCKLIEMSVSQSVWSQTVSTVL